MVVDSFPRLAARTLNFSLGLPRELVMSPDGERVVFVRSESGTTRELGLWACDVPSGTERRLCDPGELLAESDEALTGEERARRERARVQTAGITAFSTDDAVTTAVFALSSRLFLVDLVGDAPVRELTTHVAVVDPRVDPTGRRVAFAGDRGVHVVELDGGVSRLVVGPGPGEPGEVVWGLAEFIAAEELDRSHGFWWAPDGERLLVERYDETPVSVWYIADPAHPELPPRATRYPQCGTANALVSLAVVPVDGGAPVPVDWRSDVELDGTGLRVPGSRRMEWRVPGHHRAHPRPAHAAVPGSRPGHRPHHGASRGVRRCLGSSSCPGRRCWCPTADS